MELLSKEALNIRQWIALAIFFIAFGGASLGVWGWAVQQFVEAVREWLELLATLRS